MKKRPIDIFPKYFLRVPLIPLNDTFKLLSKKEITEEDLKIIFNKNIINESIFLASPALHLELRKWFSKEISDKKRIKKIQDSFLKYLIRASSRCTPFGLFAGVALGTFHTDSAIELGNAQEHHRITRLDMSFVVALAEKLSKDAEIKERILYYPNSSIYELGFDFRYLEYYYENGRRKHLVSSQIKTEYLEKIFQKALSGATYRELCLVLVEVEVDEETAKEYVNLIINDGFLINELEPSISGSDFFEQIISVLTRVENVERIQHIRNVLLSVKDKLKNLDKKLGNNTKLYNEIFEGLKKLDIDINEKHLFQTDLKLNLKHNYLSSATSESAIEAIAFLNKITQQQNKPRLEKFYKKFLDRYGDREVPLTKALDVETGIEYNSSLANDINILIDDLILPDINSSKQISYSEINEILLQKIVNAASESQYKLNLYDKDFAEFQEDWTSIPSTFYSLAQIVKCEGKQKIIFKATGGVNGAMLLTRFGHIDTETEGLIRDIIGFEEKEDGDRIYAEVVHLPEPRVGNVLKRPLLRNYEIPFMAKSNLPIKNQISIQDLYLSVKSKRLVLKSKKLNKEIVPRITSAHNFEKLDTLPIYQFLGDMQTQNKRLFLHIFNSMTIINNFEFIPRIEYKDVILYEATWNLYKKDIQKVKSFENTNGEVSEKLTKFRSEKKIPRLVKLVEKDNHLMIDFESANSIHLFFEIIKNKEHVVLQEFIGANQTIVSNGVNMFCNEVIFAFKNTKTQN